MQQMIGVRAGAGPHARGGRQSAGNAATGSVVWHGCGMGGAELGRSARVGWQQSLVWCVRCCVRVRGGQRCVFLMVARVPFVPDA